MILNNVAVIKRDGKKKPFDSKLIAKAICAAANELGYSDFLEEATEISNFITEQFAERKEVTIDEIQKAVQESLMLINTDIATKYIEYRHERDIAREKLSKLSSDIGGLIDQSNTEVIDENANKDGKVIPTQRDLLAGIVAKHYAQKHILPAHIAQAHEDGTLHYHDLDYAPFFPMFNCMLVDLMGMLSTGFKMGNAEIDTPKSITTATAVTAQIIAQVASHIYGGTTINRIDEVLAPYVTISHHKNRSQVRSLLSHVFSYEDMDGECEHTAKIVEDEAMKLTVKECYDAFQSLEYEVNTLHTANGQTPFVTLGFGLGTSWQSKLIQKSILENRIAGLGKKGKTPVFPKLVFAIREGHNRKEGDAFYDVKRLALECASKRMYPDILNYDKVVEVTGSFKTPMGCRSFLNVYEADGVEIHDGRNNLGVVSLNLPRIAIQAKGDKSKFFELLEERLRLCREALETRIDRLRGVKARVAPILYMEGACGVRLNADDDVIDIFKNGRASISLGYIGIHETVMMLNGQEPYGHDMGEVLGREIVRTMRRATDAWKKETGWAYGLYSTPSENLCNRFCKLDSKEFGLIKDVTDKGYYTNSFHLDVQKKVNPYEKLNFEMGYPELANGGFICYGEYPNMQHNIEALENVWDYSYTRVPYYGTNTPIDECYECGYTGEFDCTSKGFVCPSCGNHDSDKVSVTRRVCGYLGSPDARPFNEGKQEEVQRRVKHL